VGLVLRPRKTLEAEVLFFRKQLALYVERGVRLRRNPVATSGTNCEPSRAQVKRLLADFTALKLPGRLPAWGRQAAWRPGSACCTVPSGIVYNPDFCFLNAGLAQLVVHLICNQGVGGSNPSAGTNILPIFQAVISVRLP
jgi:hypothetical protein